MCTFCVDDRNAVTAPIMEQFWTITPITHENRPLMTESHFPTVRSSTKNHVATELIYITNKTNSWDLIVIGKPPGTKE